MKQKLETINEAECLLQDLSKKETAVLSVFWAVILERLNAISKSLQKYTIELQTAVNMLKSLSDFLTSQRDLFDEKPKHSTLTTAIGCASENDITPMMMRKKLYFFEKTSSGLKPIYRYWTDYLLSSTAACKHTTKFSRCLDF